MPGKRQILERQRVTAAIRQTAGLRTQAAVARALPDDCGQITLAGVAHAQRAVHKHLGLNARLLGDKPHLIPRTLAAKHNTRKAKIARLFCPVERVNGHLCGSVQRKIRRMRMNQARKTEILHDQRIRARFI